MQSKLNIQTGRLLDNFTAGNPKFPSHWDKFEVGLILAGFKPATVWFQTSPYGDNIAKLEQIDKQVTATTVAFLESLGLLAEVTAEDIVRQGSDPKPFRRRLVILIARDAESMELNRALWGDRSFNEDGPEFGEYPENDDLYGKLSGYPQTAIDAYGTGTSLKASQTPLEILQSPAYVAMRFVPSRDHWREELAVAEQWTEAIATNMPDVFKLMSKDIQAITEHRHD